MTKPLSNAVLGLKPSGIRKFFDIVSEMKDAISLGVGEPDFDTPWHIRDEGIYALEKGKTLSNGDILFNDGHNVVMVQFESNDILVIKPKSINEMGKIAHELGNRHLQAQFEDDTMIIEYDSLVEDKLKHDKIDYVREERVLEKAFRHVEFEHRH